MIDLFKGHFPHLAFMSCKKMQSYELPHICYASFKNAILFDETKDTKVMFLTLQMSKLKCWQQHWCWN